MIKELIDECKLQQHNKTVANTFVGSLEPRVIDHIYSKNNKKPHVIEDGGHLGNYNYHSALVTTIKESANMKTRTISDKEYQKSFELNKTNKFEKRDKDFMKMFQCKGDSKSSHWRNKELFRLQVKENYFIIKCCLCEFKPSSSFSRVAMINSMQQHFKKLHLRKYSKESIEDIKSLLDLLGFNLE